MEPIECYVDIQVGEGQHRVLIKHDDRPCDATIFVDDCKMNVTSKTLPDGGALFFRIDNIETVVTIVKENDDYDYDCFVDGKSVKNGMPWQIGKLDVPALMRWEKKTMQSCGKYVLVEILKGAFIGCLIFFILVLLQFIIPNMKDAISWWYLPLAVLPLAILFGVLSPMEYRSNNKSLNIYKKYKNGQLPEREE